MKHLFILIFTCFSLSIFAQEFVYEFNCPDSSIISYKELPNGIGSGKVNKISKVVYQYLNSITDNNYDLWYSLLSDSTKIKINAEKFPRKFKRLVNYKINNWENKEVISFKEVNDKEFREIGKTYTMVIKLPKSVLIENRVSFDPIKRVEMKDKAQYFGINIVESDSKVYQIFLHKYFTKKNASNQSNH